MTPTKRKLADAMAREFERRVRLDSKWAFTAMENMRHLKLVAAYRKAK